MAFLRRVTMFLLIFLNLETNFNIFWHLFFVFGEQLCLEFQSKKSGVEITRKRGKRLEEKENDLMRKKHD